MPSIASDLDGALRRVAALNEVLGASIDNAAYNIDRETFSWVLSVQRDEIGRAVALTEDILGRLLDGTGR